MTLLLMAGSAFAAIMLPIQPESRMKADYGRGCMKIKRPISRGQRFALLALVPVYFMLAGLFFQPLGEICYGVAEIIRQPDFLITDYFVVGGVGAAFVNAGLLTLIFIWLIYRLGVEFSGGTVTAAFMVFGFSLFGKDLLNVWPIILGVFLYARFNNESLGKHIYIGMYGASLSPIVAQVMLTEVWPFFVRLALGILVGIVIGFVLPPLAAHIQCAHQGYSLYNAGFAAGIVAIVIVSVFKAFGYQAESRLIWMSGHNREFLALLFIFYAGLILTGALSDKDTWKHYKNILRCSGHAGTDYIRQEGGCATLVNIGINGMAATLFFVLTGGDLNGPTIGSLFTILAFSTIGKHVKNILPIMVGVLLASFAMNWSITDPSAALALILSTTLAPIAGEFGAAVGVLAGFLHAAVALNVGIVYSGMNLYNNGFAGGLVATFLAPVLQAVWKRRGKYEIKN